MSFAFIFESVGGIEWLVLLGVVLVVVGPKNLPSAARKMGQFMSSLRRAADEFKRQLMAMDQEVRSTVNDIGKSVSDAAGTTDSASSSASDTSTDASQDDEMDENGYPDSSYYQANEDGFYDDTQYDYDASGTEDSPQQADASSPSSDESKKAPTEAELKAITITVSPAVPPSGGAS